MADPVIKPLVDRGIGPNLRDSLIGSQRVGDGQSSPGPGMAAARSMTGGTALDASTAGGLREDTPAKYAHLPEPLRGKLSQAAGRNHMPVQ